MSCFCVVRQAKNKQVWVTFQKWEGTVLQFHNNTLQDWHHRCNVQEDKDEGLKIGEVSMAMCDSLDEDKMSNK